MSQRSSSAARLANEPVVPPLDARTLLDLYERMVLLRRFESVAQIACRKGETPGFLHLYIGEEATAVGVCAHLVPTDWITSTHRGHGHALAKGMTPRALMAELFGKADGCCGGRGGTMHLYDRSAGLFGTNGIVAAGIGHAVGVGIGARIRGSDDVAVAFFGDGATNHGGFHESLNFAAVQKAPAVFVCENNLYATATPLCDGDAQHRDRLARPPPTAFPASPSTATTSLPSMPPLREAIARARAGDGPTLIEAQDLPHRRPSRGRPGDRHRTAPRRRSTRWAKRDPIATFRERLIGEFAVASPAELDGDRRAGREIRARMPSPSRGRRRSPIAATVRGACLRRADQSAGGACRSPAPVRR